MKNSCLTTLVLLAAAPWLNAQNTGQEVRQETGSSPASQKEHTDSEPSGELNHRNYDFKQIPFRREQVFQENPAFEQSAQPKALQPMGDPQQITPSGNRKPMIPLAQEKIDTPNSVPSLSSALASARQAASPETSETSASGDRLSPSLTKADEDSTLTISPFLSWVKQNNEAAKIAKQKATAYEVVDQKEAAKRNAENITLNIEFPGSEKSDEIGSSTVIYSTPIQ